MPKKHYRLLTLTCLLCVLAGTSTQADWVDNVGRGDNADAAAIAINRHRGDITTEELHRLNRRVRGDDLVGLAGALWFERHRADPRESVQVLGVVSGRVGHKALSYVAASPGFLPLAQALCGTEHTEVAARLIATYALMRIDAPEKLRGRGQAVSSNAAPAGNKPITFDVDLGPMLLALLTERDAETLELAILAAGFEADEQYAEAVGEHLDHRSLEIRALAMWYHGRIGRPVEQTGLDALVDRTRRLAERAEPAPVPSWDLRGDALVYSTMALGVSGHGAHVDVLVARLSCPDLRVAIEAARGLGELGQPEAVESMLAVYDTEDTPWPLKVALVEAVGRLPRAASLPELRQRYGSERGRLRQDLLYALHGLAHGEAGPEWTIEAYDTWYAQAGTDHAPTREGVEAWRSGHAMHQMQVHAVGDFYGLTILSDRPVFVLDTSASMRGAKIENLKIQLEQTLAAFPRTARFNIADFGGTINLLERQMIGGDRRMEAFHLWTQYRGQLTLGTRMFDAMELAATVPEMDTAILFTDGAPIGGQFQHTDRISAAWKVYTRYCPIALQGVVFGGRPGSNAVRGMRQLTQRYAGTTVHAD